MGRELRRVPMDFDYPLNKVWYGHFIDSISTCASVGEHTGENSYCEQCREMARAKGIHITYYDCPDFETYLAEPIKKLRELLAPPKGEGYQLWETTTEGSPVSPVFATLDELCAWCETNATVFADCKATKDEWKKMLTEDCVIYKEGNMLFL